MITFIKILQSVKSKTRFIGGSIENLQNFISVIYFQRNDKIYHFNWKFNYISYRILHIQAQVCHYVYCVDIVLVLNQRYSVIMKYFVTGLVLALSLGLALANTSQSQIEAKEDQAVQECNATNPVQRNPRLVIAQGIATGDRIKLSPEEQCSLLCFLQKVKFLNENAGIRNATGLIKYTLGQVPELAKYSDILIATIFQINRSTKGFDDKCRKAFVVYHQFGQSLFTLSIADSLQSFTGIKDKVVNAVENGQSVDKDIAEQVKQYLKFFDALITSFAKESQNQPQ